MKFKGFLANSFIIFFSLVLVLFFLEIICRILIDFDSGYYSSSKINKNKSFITHPYGKIPINEYGFFDEKFNFDKNKDTDDKVFEHNGIKIVVDKKSFLYLIGTTLEYSGGLNGKGFVFINPNASRTCGCGESFSL